MYICGYKYIREKIKKDAKKYVKKKREKKRLNLDTAYEAQTLKY